ncbi:MAG: DUF4340 domain-containing protein [Spirochaetaceae bacterium]|jgi:hypothetical protein|nr:DUF4340 domain-containing protein [Spirochaetaceae bacterium]
MVYKQKLLLLSALTGVLALAYAATLIFSPDRMGSRRASHVWLEGSLREKVGRIELSGGGQSVTLVRNGGGWYAEAPEAPGELFPAKTARVEDLLRLLSLRAPYPLRESSPASHERLGLGGGASRILVRDNGGAPLLDLLVGGRDATGREVYLRENNRNEVRSGEDLFSAYLEGGRTAWYNLRLLSGRDGGTLDSRMVQRVIVTAPAAPPEPGGLDPAAPAAPAEPGEKAPPLVFTRSADGWLLEGTGPDSLENSRIDSYVRGILEAEGEDFLVEAGNRVFADGSISLEMGDGARFVIQLGPRTETGEDPSGGGRPALVSGSPYVYALAEWTVNRIFRDRSYFVKQDQGAAP